MANPNVPIGTNIGVSLNGFPGGTVFGDESDDNGLVIRGHFTGSPTQASLGVANTFEVGAEMLATDTGLSYKNLGTSAAPSFTSGSSNQAVASVTLTSAQIIALNGTPITVVPAPGAGKAIIVNNTLTEFIAGGTQFTGGGAVSYVYHGTATPAATGTIAATVITSASSSNTQLGPDVSTTGTTVLANTGVDITNATAAFAAGNGSIKCFVYYSTVTL